MPDVEVDQVDTEGLYLGIHNAIKILINRLFLWDYVTSFDVKSTPNLLSFLSILMCCFHLALLPSSEGFFTSGDLSKRNISEENFEEGIESSLGKP